MANEELGKLSPEQIQKLAGTISEAKNLTNQQEEIIKKVLAGETEIGNLRIAYLNQYFDLYSEKLDQIIARKTSALNDTFLILDKKLNESYKTLSSDITKLEKQIADIGKSRDEMASSESSKKEEQEEASSPDKSQTNLNDALKALADTYRQEGDARADAIRTGNNTLIGLEKQYQDQRASQLSQHLDQLAQAAKVSTTQFATPTSSSPIPEVTSSSDTNSGSVEIEADEVYQTTPDTTRAQVKNPENDQGQGDSDITEQLDRWKNFFLKNEEERQNAILAGTAELGFDQQKIVEKYNELHKSTLKKQAEQVEEIRNQMIDLEVARMQKEMGLVDQINQYRLDSQQKAIAAEIEALTALNNFEAGVAASEQHADEIGANRAREVAAQDSLAEIKKREEQMAKERAKLELKYKRQNNGILTKESAAQIEKELAAKYKAEKKNEENLSKERARLAKIDERKSLVAERQETQEQANVLLGKGATLAERKQALFAMTHDENGDFDGKKALAAAINTMGDLIAKLNGKIDTIAAYQKTIDTRLQGSNNKTKAGSYWGQLTRDMMSVGAVTPFFRQEDFANNIKALVEKGISFDLKQRAFLMTIQEKIANTFDVADGTLLRLIRIQQEDSTAGRLGMESALNSFLNNMYETSEYLSDVASSVRGSLQEMEALMTGAEATEVEYQVQKWMGSLYSVGMSQDAVQGIASALGQIAAGQVEALTGGSGAGNLLVMAANEAGIPIADILTDGLTAKETNKLLQATVNYLAEIAESSKDNRVVQQQLAGVFGVKASDLRAATNLATKETTASISKSNLTYDNMLRQLNNMAGTMNKRTSLGEMMTNVWENGQYTLASSIANSPASYLLFKMASLLQDTTGGIDLPFINVMGFGVDLNTTVADLMRVGSLAGGILGSLGSMVSGLGSSFSGRAMLSTMGIESGSKLAITPRGDGGGIGSSDGGGAQTTSGSGYVGNSSGNDIKNSTIQESEDSKKKQMIEAKEEEEDNKVDALNMFVLKIYELLDDIASGKRSFSVKMSNFGLTGSGKASSAVSAQGGVAGLLSNSAANNYGSSFGTDAGSTTSSAGGFSGTSGGSAGSEAVSSSFGSGLDLGGWTMM